MDLPIPAANRKQENLNDIVTVLPFALYDAFSDRPFNGSQAGIVCDAGELDDDARLKIAREFGWPATCFVSATSSHSVTARFQSTIREYPMCGHGTICLMTMMVNNGIFDWDIADNIMADLVLPTQTSSVEITKRADGRALVMLDFEPPNHRLDVLDVPLLLNLLGIRHDDLVQNLPLQTVVGSFTHLVVPLAGDEAMTKINPDFSELANYCRRFGIETVAVFCTQVENRDGLIADTFIKVRDFCPAVGVTESAAAGTTNAALTSYLIKHGLVGKDGGDKFTVISGQGLEIGRPSVLHSVVTLQKGKIIRLQVGGVATKVLEGQLSL
jgi:trans-2,3-dihydro-3-hydroxyanthranilate isomerase